MKKSLLMKEFLINKWKMILKVKVYSLKII